MIHSSKIFSCVPVFVNTVCLQVCTLESLNSSTAQFKGRSFCTVKNGEQCFNSQGVDSTSYLHRSILLFQGPAWRPGLLQMQRTAAGFLGPDSLPSASVADVHGHVVPVPVILFVHLQCISRNDRYFLLPIQI